MRDACTCPRSVRRGGLRAPLAGVLLTVALAPASAAQAPPATQPARMAELLRPPEMVEALQKLRQSLQDEMDALRPTTQPATAPATRPAGGSALAATETYLVLQKLLDVVDRQLALRGEIQRLKNREHIETLAKELTGLQGRIQEIERLLADPPPYVTEEEVKAAQDEYEARLQDLNTRVAVQTQRARTLASAPQRRIAMAEAQHKAQAEFQETAARLTAQLALAKSEDERQGLALQLRAAEVRGGLPLFEEVQDRLIEERETLLQEQGERRIPLLQTLTERLNDWRNLLQRIRSRSEKERIEEELKFVERHPDLVPAYEKAYWELRLLEANARDELAERQREIGGGRFAVPPEADPRLIAAQQASWNSFMESLEDRPSDQVRDRFIEVQEAIADWQRRLLTPRNRLNNALEEQQAIIARIDEYDRQIARKEAEFRDTLNRHLLKNPEDTRAEQVSQQHAEAKRRYVEQARTIRTDLQEIITRLKASNASVLAFLEELEQHRSRLYWRYLFVPARPAWQYRPSVSAAEWRSAREVEERSRDIETLRRRLARVRGEERGQWIFAAVVIVAVAVASGWIRARARRYADAMMQAVSEAETPDEQRAPLAERLHLLTARFVARTVMLVLPGAVALLFVKSFGMGRQMETLVMAAILFGMGAVVAEALIRVLFVPGKPRIRLLRCSNVVAAYYRRWAMALWVATVLLVPVPLLLWSLGWVYYTRVHLWGLYKIVAIAMLLVFALRRQTVLRVVGRRDQVRHPRVLAAISVLYPVFWTAGLVLLGLEVAGYGALVTYVIGGTVATVATVALALLITRYLTELVAQYRPVASGNAPMDAPRTSQAVDEEPSLSSGAGILLSLSAPAIRLAVAAVAIFLILRSWGIRSVEIRSMLAYEIIAANPATGRMPVTLGRVLAAGMAVVVAGWASRVVRSVLDSRIYPAYPEIDQGGRAAINTITHYFLILLGVYFALHAMRVPLGALTVVLGTLGLGVGLGLQPLFVNFISGLMILFERHVRVGDIAGVDGQIGEVTSISMRSTTIRTPDNIEIVMPNSDFITKGVTNWTLQNPRLRAVIDVGVAYGTDPELVRRLLLDIARRDPLVLVSPPPEVWFVGFGDNALNFQLMAWFASPANRWKFMTQVRYEIVRCFNEHKIEIPFPQRTLSTISGQPLPIRVVGGELPRAEDCSSENPAVGSPPREHGPRERVSDEARR